ncbi:MAG: hypothetical protein ACRD4K_01370, partial [Candidatus Acidiferrales bacterium]
MHRAKCFLASVLPESLRLFAVAILIVDFTFPSFSVRAQGNMQQPHEGDEIAVNLACGSATIAMVRDGVVIAALEDPIEPNTRP